MPNLKNPKAVLFDLDGTLIDTAPDFYRALGLLAKEQGFLSLSMAQVRAKVSHGARAMVDALLQYNQNHQAKITYHADLPDDFDNPNAPIDGAAHLRARLLELYENHIYQDSVLFVHANWLDVLNAHAHWGVVTNKPRHLSQKLISAMGLNPDVLICPDDVATPKPAPDALLLACKRLGIRPKNAIYAGDHARDILAAKSAGMPSLACAFGYLDDGDDAHAWGADEVCDTPNDLMRVIDDFIKE